jgi:cytochrome c biogenesis protein CcdA/thiol-disulfide isomerase/thioredoxin
MPGYLRRVLVLLGIGFLAGVVTAISPCILPVLPILLAGGASGRRPLRIIAGLILSFVVFTLFATWLLGELGLPDDLLRNVAIALLFVVAATLLVPRLGLLLERPFARLTRFRAGGGGFVLGASLGLVFVPCAGPVLATISVVAATNRVGLHAVLLTIAYAAGAAGPMLLIAFGGRQLAGRLRTQGPRVRFASGIVIGLVALAINLDSRFQTALPGYTQALQSHIEDTATAERELRKINGTKSIFQQATTTQTTPVAQAGPGASDLPVLVQSAPEIIAGGRWFNSKPLTLASLRGKVVLIDFWTYSCINCLRTLPHLEAWYAAYHKEGLVIIGVHSPEFAFEHVASNVQAAVKRLGITYPVVQDNNFATWNAYSNEYWPADYLIDQQGRIRAYSTGEGGYTEMEENIQQLLGVYNDAAAVPDMTPTEQTTPESYLGYLRLDPSRYVGASIAQNTLKDYPARASVPLNSLAYSGNWRIGGQTAVAGADAGLSLHFQGHDVYLVLGGSGRVGVSIDGKATRTIVVNADKLYTLESSSRDENALLGLKFTPGVDAYAFTFG